MPSHPSWAKQTAIFTFIWGCAGYVLGTATLLGPVRWVTDALRHGEASEGTEKLAVLGLMGALVVSSALLAGILTRTVLRSRGAARFGIPVAAAVAALGCMWVWMTPSLMSAGTGEEITISSNRGGAVSPPVAPVGRSHDAPGKGGDASRSTLQAVGPVEETGGSGAPKGAGAMQTVEQRQEGSVPEPATGFTADSRAGTAPAARPAARVAEAVAAPLPRPLAETSFTFGPYPDEARLRRLHDDGFDGVVSLLHPAVVPFEPKLMADERKATERVGIRLHHLPMLPWVGDNAESLGKLRELAGRPGRYYVHCYLGRDRVRLAQAVVSRALAGETRQAAVTVEDGMAPGLVLDESTRFERGEVHALGDQGFLTPYPTDEEFASYVVPTHWGAVVTLLDPEDPDQRRRIDAEREILARYGLDLHVLTISTRPYDPQRVLAVVAAARELPPPLLVHGFFGPSTGKGATAEAFLQAWNSGLPPVPTSHVRDGVGGGPARVAAPNVVFGPRPAAREFGALRRRGIRHVLHVGSREDSQADEIERDRAAAAAAPVEFESVDPGADPEWSRRLASGGPWYVYGPGAEKLQAQTR